MTGLYDTVQSINQSLCLWLDMKALNNVRQQASVEQFHQKSINPLVRHMKHWSAFDSRHKAQACPRPTCVFSMIPRSSRHDKATDP